MKPASLLIIVLLFIKTSAAAEFNKVGTTGFVFLQLPVTARYLALGETGITLPDLHSEGIFVNPALLAMSDKKFLANVSYADWYVETSHQALGITYNLGILGIIGVHGLYFNFGEVQKTRNPFPTETGSYINLGTYSASGMAFGLSYARLLTDQFALGVTMKYVREEIDSYSADNVIFDIGFLYFTGVQSLRVGAFLQNFGLDARYVEQKFKMPQQMKLGISAEVWGSLQDANHVTLLAEVAHPNDVNEHLQFGLETVLLEYLVLRGGYKFGYDAENITLGLGLRFDFQGNAFRFDAAYMAHDYLESTMRYTLIMEF